MNNSTSHPATELLKSLISISSFSGEEKGTADLIQEYLESKGLQVNRLGNNCWVSTEIKSNRPTILLNSHHDTVKPGIGWNTNPFEPLVENGKIIGLGANDAGASVVSLLHVFLTLREKEQSYNLIFLASAEEENSGKNGVASVLPIMPKIDLAIVGEPTEMHPAVAEKGLMVVDFLVKGESGHAAREEGVNAIYLAMKELEKIADLSFDKVSEWLGKVKVTPTIIEAGKQHNVIPDLCKLVLDVRTTDQYTNEEVLEILRSKLKGELTPRSTRLNPSGIDVSHPVVKRLIEMGRVPYGSPTLSDQSLMNFPSVKLGPGYSGRSHTANEFIFEREITEGIEMYLSLLDQLSI